MSANNKEITGRLSHLWDDTPINRKNFVEIESSLAWDNPWEEIYRKIGVPEDLISPYYGFGDIQEALKKHAGEKDKAGIRVLDVAGGPGRHTIKLAEMGFRVFSFDVSKTAIELAKEAAIKNNVADRVNFRISDMFGTYPYREGYFDSIIAIQAIYHGYQEHMQKAIDEIHRISKPNALFAFTVSMDCDRAMMGAKKYKTKEVAPFTFIPQVGREKGLPHFYPDEQLLEKMLRPKFNNIRHQTDLENSYRQVFCNAIKE